jgi:hypothetical protein
MMGESVIRHRRIYFSLQRIEKLSIFGDEIHSHIINETITSLLIQIQTRL